MVCAQAEKASVVRPKTVLVRNRKDELEKIISGNRAAGAFHVVCQSLTPSCLVWKASEVDNGTASSAICTLRDALWYIERHHQTLTDRS